MQHLDEAAGMIQIRDHRAFGDLEADVGGNRAGVIEAVDHELQEIRIAERLSRDVDRDAAPLGQLQAAAAERRSTACTTQRSISDINR